ncbi:MAG: signal recognition particle-docking protein FtsY [Anaerolineales bacterium]
MLGHKAQMQQSLTKTRRSFFGRIAELFRGEEITEDTWDELEMLLLQADVGVKTTMGLISTLRAEAESGQIKDAQQAQDRLKAELLALLRQHERPYLAGRRLLNVVLVVGVNGSGKTTSIAKLAYWHKQRGDRVLLAAADTFRAAAIDQLQVWGKRAGVDVIAHQPGADPGAVLYDAIVAAQARGCNTLIVDTAGRLHTQHNLMQELKKLASIAHKQVHQAPHEVLLVLDATTGQNALAQAQHFTEAVGVTGVVLAKLDSTARGGMVFAVGTELGLPVLFAATGEQIDDWAPFDAEQFVEGLFANED